MTSLELIAVAFGLANVVLIVRRNVWNYPFGIVMVCLYGWIFYDVKLYSDALLQVFFLIVQVYGWINWLENREGDGTVVVIEAMTPINWANSLIWSTVLSAGLGFYMANWTDAALPYPDAYIAGTSIVAQVLLSRRKIQSWVLWIAVDVMAIGVYIAKGLYPTAALYAVFLCLATWGLMSWYRVLKGRNQRIWV